MKNNEKKTNNSLGYSFYSKVLNKPYDSLSELAAAEAEYYEAKKAKEEAAAQKKAEAQKVEEAFKALNTARKVYKEDLTQLTKEYADSLDNLKKAFDLGKRDIKAKLAGAEDQYEKALNDFVTKHPEGYHLTLRDGDFETTISSQTATESAGTDVNFKKLSDIFDIIFNF